MRSIQSNHATRQGRRVFIQVPTTLFVFLSAILLTTFNVGLAHAQYPGLECQWLNRTIPVYFNPGTLAANGFSVAGFRGELNDAMATWNEESQGQYDLVFGGDTAWTTEQENSIVVLHQDV